MGNITSQFDPGNVGPDTGAAGDNIVDCTVTCQAGTLTDADFDNRLA
jgi:hypothetical protein